MHRETTQTQGLRMGRDPQAAAAQRSQDKESKRARGALSCAECRRLKLKCDKTVPCSSCKRRGCSAICPNGSLITGQGTRFVLADTEKLHQKIAAMSDRIRQLEDALAVLQSTQTRDPHPLLHRDLLKIKSSIELHAAAGEGGGAEEVEEEAEESQAIDAFGTLAIRDDGAATFYGRSAGSESLLIGEASSSSTDPHSHSHSLAHTPGPEAWSPHAALPASIRALARPFPFSLPASILSHAHTHTRTPAAIDLDHLVRTYLPPWPEACRLCELYMEQAPWFFGAVTRRQLEEEVLPLWYEEAPRPGAVSAVTPHHSSHANTSANANANTNTAPHAHLPTAPVPVPVPAPASVPTRAPHDLALLFILLCFGALTDPSVPSSPTSFASPSSPTSPTSPSAPSPASSSSSSSASGSAALAEAYYDLTKAALGLAPVLEGPPAVATVQALALMAIYEGMRGGEHSIERTWGVMGLSTKLAQSIGLHRDCARWKLSPAEVQKRRALFWELFITDCWQSLATGRLATFSLPFVDCELPFDPDQTMTDDGVVQPSFPYWKARFGAECVSAVVQGTLTSRAPRHSIILELDRKVRDMELPAYAQGAPPPGAGLAQTMSHFMPTTYRELTLLYIHRGFFAHAIVTHPQDPVKSQYAPSFLAGYRSACTILALVKQQFELFPAQISRFWVLWTHAFSAAVLVSSVVTHSSQSKVAPAALLELRTACELFERGSTYGGRAGKFLPILQRLHMKAQQTFIDTNSGIPPSIPNDIFKPTPPDNAKDELSIFSGKTHTVATKAHTPSSSSGSRTATAGGRPVASSSRGSSQAPGPLFGGADNPSFAGVHPSLVSELHAFDGHIAAQIRDAYEVGGGVYARPMDNMRERRHQMQMAERERERERVEMERQHAERQEFEQQRVYREHQMEVEQQQQEQYQQQQQQRQVLQEQQRLQEAQRQLEQAEMERQRHLQQQEQQQRQPAQHHQQSQMHQQFQAHHPQYEQQYERHGAYANSEHHVADPTPIPSQPPRHLSHSQSQPSLHHAFVPEHHQPRQQPRPQAQSQVQQHSMYIVPPEYRHQYPTPESTASPDSATSSHFPGHGPGFNHVHVQQPQQAPPEGAYQYWLTQGTGYATPAHAAQTQSHPQPQHHHYTPEAAMEGIAADDRSLQETWQSYMYKVGTPRHFFED